MTTAAVVGSLSPALVAPAALAATPTVWQGAVFVTSVTAACAASDITANDSFTIVYRPKLAGVTAAEGLAFASGRSDVLLTSTAVDGRMTGNGTYKSVAIGSHATASTGTGLFNIGVAPTAITASTTTISLAGTITNFFDTSGCTIGFRAALTRRP